MRSEKFTLLEILAVIAVILLLMALSVPAYHKIKAKSRMTECASNLRQIGLCINSYVNDNKDRLPVCERLNSLYGMPMLKDVLSTYLNDNLKIFKCPADNSVYNSCGTSYEWNTFINGLQIDRNTFQIGDYSISEAPLCGDADSFHNGRSNYLYPDGRILESMEVLIKDE